MMLSTRPGVARRDGVVALISLVTKVSSIEVTRQAAGDLDRELYEHTGLRPDCRAVRRHP